MHRARRKLGEQRWRDRACFTVHLTPSSPVVSCSAVSRLEVRVHAHVCVRYTCVPQFDHGQGRRARGSKALKEQLRRRRLHGSYGDKPVL
jgi:hypothetical protein